MLKTKVAIIGLGTVGAGVARLLLDYGDRTARHAGRTLWLERVVVRDPHKPRGVELPPGILTTNIDDVIRDPEITAVAELIGGLEPARSLTLRLLESGKDIVTANKALLAESGAELFDRARELGRSIAFEAAVAGGIPIVANIGTSLAANQILVLEAILNGTSNFILTEMESKGMGYAEALAQAKRLGYAEADATMDVDGTDATQKLAILAHLAFGARVHWKDVPREGIDRLDSADMRYALELGYRIKLLAVARLRDEALELHVAPTLVRLGSPLAEVYGAFNAIHVVGDAVGPVFFQGLGAGQMPTASAVVADLIDTVVGRTAITFRTLELWSHRAARVTPADYAAVRSRYYFRFQVEDRPGVLAEISGVLGAQGISIASVIQHECLEGAESLVPLVIMTHQTTEGAAQSALSIIDRLPCTRGSGVKMRVRDGSTASR